MKNNKTKITFEYEKKEYTLEFTADSIKKMEKQGFNFNDIDSHILNVPEELFSGAFIANHADTPKKVREEIYHELSADDEEGTKILDVLQVMLKEAFDELFNHKGNVSWRVVK